MYLSLVQSPPRISKQPPTDEQLFQVAQAKINENDKPFLIECEAEGEPAPRYKTFIISPYYFTHKNMILKILSKKITYKIDLNF